MFYYRIYNKVNNYYIIWDGFSNNTKNKKRGGQMSVSLVYANNFKEEITKLECDSQDEVYTHLGGKHSLFLPIEEN